MHTLTITATAYPTGTLARGSSYSIDGTVTSNYRITSVKGEIISSSGRVMYTGEGAPGAPDYQSFLLRGSNVDKGLVFNALPDSKEWPYYPYDLVHC